MVKLKVVYEAYERYGGGGTHSATVSGETLKEALLKMCDRMGLYIDSETIQEKEEEEEREITAQEILDDIESSNGDGCDYIISLKDLISGEVYIEEDYEEEDWDD